MQLSALLRRWARGNVLDSPVLAKKARSSRRGCGSRCARAVAFFGGEPGSRGRAVADGAAGGRGKAASKQAITAGPAERRVGRVCAERYGCWRVGWRMSGEHDAHGPVRRVGRLVRPIEADPVYVSYIEPCLRVRPQKKVYLKSAPRTLAPPRVCGGRVAALRYLSRGRRVSRAHRGVVEGSSRVDIEGIEGDPDHHTHRGARGSTSRGIEGLHQG